MIRCSKLHAKQWVIASVFTVQSWTFYGVLSLSIRLHTTANRARFVLFLQPKRLGIRRLTTFARVALKCNPWVFTLVDHGCEPIRVEDIYNVWVVFCLIATRFRSLGHSASQSRVSTFFLLLDLMQFFDLFHAGELDTALDVSSGYLADSESTTQRQIVTRTPPNRLAGR